MEVAGTGATRRLSMISFRPQNDVKKVGPPTFQAIPCFPCSKKSVPQHTFSNPQNHQNFPMKTEIRTLTCQPLFKTKIQNMIFFRTASLILTIISQAKTLLGLSPKLQLRDISTQLLKQSFTLAMRKVRILCKVLNTTYARPASMCCKANILNFY